MADPIKPVNPLISIQPLATGVNSRENQAAPNILSALADGTVVTGFVINRDANNNPILRTPSGDVVVQSDMFLKTGSEVVFRVDSSQTSRAQIVTIDTLSPELYSAQANRGLTQDTIVQPSLQGLTPQAANAALQNQPLPTLEAVVLQPATRTDSATTLSLTQLPELESGTPIALTIVDIRLPPLPVAINTVPQSPQVQNLLNALLPQASQAAGQPAPPAAMTLPTTFSPALTATLLNQSTPAPTIGALPPEIVALLVPPAPTATTRANAIAANATATNASPTPTTAPATDQAAAAEHNQTPAASTPVAANTVPGNGTAPSTPTTAAPAQTLSPSPQPAALQPAGMQQSTPNAGPAATPAPGAASPNSTIVQATVIGHSEDGANILHTEFATLKVFTPQPLPTGTVLDVKTQAMPMLQIAQATPVLLPRLPDTNFTYISQALASLAQTDPATAQSLLAQLPVIGPKFTSGLLFFLAAVKSGNVRDILAVRDEDRLDALMPGLFTKLGKDIETLHQEFTNSPLTDWKAVQLPLIFGNEAYAAKLFIRDQEEGNKTAASAAITGHRFLIDIDFSEFGAVQFDGFVRNQTKSLELCLRSSEPLDATIGNEIRQIFASALQTTGLTGQIAFQHGPERFVRPQMKPATGTEGGFAQTILA